MRLSESGGYRRGEWWSGERWASWATHPCVATPTLRNSRVPQRREIFAGVRLGPGA